MTPKPNDSAAVFDAVALERDLAKLNLERPITEYRQFFEFMPAGQMRRCELMALHETSMHPIYIGETPEVIAMCNRLNQYLRMIRTLSGGLMSPSFIFDYVAASPDLITHNWRNGTILCHLIDDFIPSGQEVSLRSFKGRIIATKPMKTWANGQILDAEDVMFTADDEAQRQRLGFSVHGVVVSAGDIPIFYIGEIDGFPIDVSRGLLYRTITVVWDNGPNKVADISDPARMTSALTRAATGGLSIYAP